MRRVYLIHLEVVLSGSLAVLTIFAALLIPTSTDTNDPSVRLAVLMDTGITATFQAHDAEEYPQLLGGCYNCAEGFYHQRPAHWWHGTDGCEIGQESNPGCADCNSPHCDDPSVPHDGSCPASCGIATFAAGMLRTGSVEQIARIPGLPVFVASSSDGPALQVLNCSGNVAFHVAMSRQEADLVRVVIEQKVATPPASAVGNGS